MYSVVFSPHAEKDLRKLSKNIKRRILAKLTYFSQQTDPVSFSKPLINLPPATHRFRIGDYRIAFFVSEETIFVESIGHRREIYK